MKLPSMKYADGIVKRKQIKFGGLNHSLGAGDGELWDMRNLTSDLYPALATRPKRQLHRRLTDAGGIFAWEGLCWVEGTGFYYRGEKKGTVTRGQKQFASMNKYIAIFPDKCCYNIDTGEFRSLEASLTEESLTFCDGLLYGEPATANAIRCDGVNWAEHFQAGDAVEISGCTTCPANNKSIIIRGIDGDTLYFYENSFIYPEGNTEGYTENGSLTIRRSVPDLLYICENNGRLWGCTDTTIYASKWNDIFNWNVYDGLESDAWALTPSAAGNFTGCVSYRGSPIFFKENYIFKVYGDVPSDFDALDSATLGLAAGSAGSLAVAGETLFYLSRSGIMAYTGGIPRPIGEVFGTKRFKNAVAGSDGLKYYVSMQEEGGSWGLYVYDTQRGMWHMEDGTCATHFAFWESNLCCLNDRGEIWKMGTPQVSAEDEGEEDDVEWFAESSDFTEEDPNKKRISKLQIRLELENGATVQAWLQFDSDGMWHRVREAIGEGVKRSYYLPIVPRRCDHYRLKLTGKGGCRIYSIVREVSSGSELKSTYGRN